MCQSKMHLSRKMLVNRKKSGTTSFLLNPNETCKTHSIFGGFIIS